MENDNYDTSKQNSLKKLKLTPKLGMYLIELPNDLIELIMTYFTFTEVKRNLQLVCIEFKHRAFQVMSRYLMNSKAIHKLQTKIDSKCEHCIKSYADDKFCDDISYKS